MRNTIGNLFTLAAVVLGAVSAHAAVIVQNKGGTTGNANPAYYYGESFQTPSDFLYYNITFNFYSDVPATTPSAAGTAFLLSQPYAGTPAGLSMTTPGFLTESTSATNGIFTFNPNFVLLTNTEYYLYTNAPLLSTGGNIFSNANSYFAPSGTTAFTSLVTAANFSLNGTRVGVPLPEPSSQTALYVLSGVVGLGFVVMRRRVVA